jgi:hypothetical protein
MQQEEPGHGGPLGPLDWLKIMPFEAAASSNRLGWVGLEAARYRAPPTSELSPPSPTTGSSFSSGRLKNWTCFMRE